MQEQPEHPVTWSTVAVVGVLLASAIGATWELSRANQTDALTQRVSEVERRMTTVENWMGSANDKLGTINTNVALIQEKLAFIGDARHAGSP